MDGVTVTYDAIDFAVEHELYREDAEFSGGRVPRDTQYFGDPFKPWPYRAHPVDRNN